MVLQVTTVLHPVVVGELDSDYTVNDSSKDRPMPLLMMSS